MEVPFQRTEDRFELTLATNHVGPCALTGLLLDRLLSTPNSRIVTVSSLAHQCGVMHFEQGYQPSEAYAQSKLADLLFTHELHSRPDAAGNGTIALAAHPGNARTTLRRTSSLLERALISKRLRPLTFWLAQDSLRASLPILRAVSDPEARGGDYYSPGGWFEYTGYPIRVEASPASHDPAARLRLWEISEQLTGVTYPLPAFPHAQTRAEW